MPRPNSEIAVEEAEVVNLQKSCLKPKTSHHKFDKSIMKQALACSSAYFAAMALGAVAGFSGVTIPQLQVDKSGIYLTDEQISWFASLPTFATIPTCVIGGFLGQIFGRKMAMILVQPILLIGFICQAAAQDVEMLQFGRLLCGLASGLVSGPAATYVSEISNSDWRTTFGAGIGLSFLVGTMIIYILGAICSWRVIAGISGIFPVLSFLAGLFSPESPTWLATKGMLEEAKKALAWFEPTADDSEYEAEVNLLQNVFREKTEASHSNSGVSETCMGKLKMTCVKYFRVITRQDVWRPMLTMILMCLLQQFSGMTAVSYYAVEVLENSHSSVDKYLGTIIFGLTRFAAQFLGSYLLLKFQRRHMFITSALMTGLGMVLLGVASMPMTSGISNSTSTVNDAAEPRSEITGALPLISVMLAAIGYQSGLSPITWSYLAELFPVDVRAELTGLSSCFANLAIFLVVKTYPNLSRDDVLGLHGAYWLYASVCLVDVFFGCFLMPETKGKALEDISNEFSKRSSRKRARINSIEAAE